jgi:hypothetical protein
MQTVIAVAGPGKELPQSSSALARRGVFYPALSPLFLDIIDLSHFMSASRCLATIAFLDDVQSVTIGSAILQTSTSSHYL